MTHTLTFVRHGKSEAPADISDKARTLSARGSADVLKIAHRLKEQGLAPTRIVSSDATRAVMTATILGEILETEVVYNSTLYNTDESSVLSFLSSVEENIVDLMLVGHNPTWEELVHFLSGEFYVMPPASVVQIELLSSWKDLREGMGKVIYYDYPNKA